MTLAILDYIVIGLYFVGLIAAGWFFSRRGETQADYFIAGKRLPGWAAGISIIGTKFSAISYVAFPAKAFESNWTFLIMQGATLAAALLIALYYIPIICSLNITTAYEYLEKRFGPIVQKIGACKFVAFETMRSGALVYMPSIILSVVTGMQIEVCILIIGIIATLYTVLGGIEAVVWTDVVQVSIMFFGAILCIVVALTSLGEEAIPALGEAYSAGKMQIIDTSLNLGTVTVWVMLLSLPSAANSYLSDQDLVQRYLSVGSVREARKSMLITATVGPLLLLILFFLGTSLYVFYSANAASLPAYESADEILPLFIAHELPAGVSGLLIGAIFAATMSSLDSVLNSSCSVLLKDFRKPRRGKTRNEASASGSILPARAITIGLGTLGTGLALMLARLEIESLLDFWLEVVTLVGAGIAGIFLLGIFTTKVGSIGALTGFAAGTAGLVAVKFLTDIHYFVYGTVGVLLCFCAGYVVSMICPCKRDLRGLTFHTLRKFGG